MRDADDPIAKECGNYEEEVIKDDGSDLHSINVRVIVPNKGHGVGHHRQQLIGGQDRHDRHRRSFQLPRR